MSITRTINFYSMDDHSDTCLAVFITFEHRGNTGGIVWEKWERRGWTPFPRAWNFSYHLLIVEFQYRTDPFQFMYSFLHSISFIPIRIILFAILFKFNCRFKFILTLRSYVMSEKEIFSCNYFVHQLRRMEPSPTFWNWMALDRWSGFGRILEYCARRRSTGPFETGSLYLRGKRLCE